MISLNILFGFFIFSIGIFSFFSFKTDLIRLIIALELLLLGLSILFFSFSFLLDDASGSFFSLISLILAGAESAILLSLFITYFPFRGSL